MVFIYLPFYFGIGGVLFFILFLLWRQWSKAPLQKAPPQEDNQARPHAEPQGGAQGPPTGNWTGVIMIFVVVAFVIGLVSFAVGRATLPRRVFATDFPEGWGPLGFEIPAMLLGALAASFFIGGPTRRAAGPDAKDGAEDEWLRRDRGPALLVAAFAFLLIFAALEYDYNLLGEVTKFSAGPVVSLELAQPVQNAKDAGNSGSRLRGELVAAAQPRTQSITYVTSQLTNIYNFILEDDRTAQIFSGVEAPTYIDQWTSNMRPVLETCIQPLGYMLSQLQKIHHSEFPSVSGIVVAVTGKEDKSLEESNQFENAEQTVLMSSLLMRRLYDGISTIRDVHTAGSGDNKEAQQNAGKYVNTVVAAFAAALRDYEYSVEFDFNLVKDLIKDDKKQLMATNICSDKAKTAESMYDSNITDEIPPRSNAVGYLAMLTALAEFADGNRESAIRLLNHRISIETENLDALNTSTKRPLSNDLYVIARKQILIRRLIRVEYNLIELVQDPVRSPALDQIAFDLTIQGIKLDPILLMANQVKQSFDRVDLTSGQSRLLSASVATLAKSSPAFAAAILADSPNDAKSATTDEAISDDIVIAALKPTPDGRCSDEIMSIGSEGSEEAMKRIAFYLAVIDHLQFINNALNYVGKNGEIVLAASWSGDKKDKPLERNSTQSDLIAKLDSFAGRLIKILKSQDQDALGCLAEEGEVSGFLHSSTLLNTIGSYFEMKGKNFGAAAPPRVADYDESSSGPVQRGEDRIKSLCYALVMYEDAIERLRQEDALERLRQLDQPSPDKNIFAKSLAYYDQFEHQQTLSSKPAALKELLNQTYTQGQIHQYCSNAYP